MANHKLKIEIPSQEIGSRDVEFSVYRDGSKLGTLRISKGNIQWATRNGKKFKKKSWPKFDELMSRP
jgi:hypothetical protein